MAQTRVPFETLAQQRLRNVRRSSDDDQRPDLVGYVDVEGNIRGLIGDAVAPYVNALGLASSDGTTGLVQVGDGEAQRVAVDEYGRIWTRSAAGLETNLTFHAAAGDNQTLVRQGATRLFQIRCITAPAIVTDRFLQVHNAAQANLANGATPVWEMLIPAATTVATQYAEAGDDFEPIDGLLLSTGLVLALSTTPGTLTFAGATDGFFQASYRAG